MVELRRGPAMFCTLMFVALLVFCLWCCYLTFEVVPLGPLVADTHNTARTYHRCAVSDVSLNPAIFLKLNQIIEGVPRPRAEGGGVGEESHTHINDRERKE